jgi:tyrosinase
MYHHALVDECGYGGELPYWDWTLDWQTLFSAPVWDLKHGFLGNVRANSNLSALFPRSRCVSEGHSANSTVAHASSASAPHCLTRDLASGELMNRLMQHIQLDAIKAPVREGDHY